MGEGGSSGQTKPSRKFGTTRTNRQQQQNKIMKTLTKFALVAAILTTAVATQAGTVRGYFRSNGTYVAPHYRTPANGTPYDNLSYRGYPSQEPGYVSPRSYGLDSSLSRPLPRPSSDNYNFSTMPRPYTGNSSLTPLKRPSSSFGF